MNFKNLVDTHTHTDNSFDGNESATKMTKAAIAKGLSYIAFTDHVEADNYKELKCDVSASGSFFDSIKAKKDFDGQIQVLSGIELGEACFNPELAEEIICKYKYDIVVASLHNLRDTDDFCFYDYSDIDIDALLDEYFTELAGLAQWGKFDTMAHMTYPLRYIVGKQNIPVDLSRHKKQVDEVLKLLAEKDLALEINVSGLRQEIKDTMPGEAIVKRFKELGGKHITLGSDAHYSKHIALGVEKGYEIAKRCGFDCVTVFKNRQPIQIPIE